MIRRPPRSTLDRSSAASDVYKRQLGEGLHELFHVRDTERDVSRSVSYTHLRAHETPEHLVCRLLLEKKNVQDRGGRRLALGPALGELLEAAPELVVGRD